MKPAPVQARATSGGGTKARIPAEQRAAILRLLDEGPRVPWESHVYAYLQLAAGMHANAETIYNETEREIRDAARFVEAGRIRLKNPDSFLTAAHKALRGNADAFEYVANFIRRTSGMRSGIHTERLRERNAEPTVTLDA